ncbi:hypothetical protein RHSIM_Rhsim01G0153200 [Rhododendron simsii]|uniref:DYW domain-containing protein n=1 Tax=Rhododendron simsii TaxID=118357 RepID=A0A834HIZ1_RHOSS|nr:hypothetical protein RHSIM_Rhsim01G0153200 [Rhododendron simsii]
MSERDEFTWNTMVAAYEHSGRLAEAKQLFDEAPKKCSITWSVYSSKALLSRGEQLLALVIMTRFDSNAFVNTGLVDMYAKCDSIVEAEMIFDDMPERKSHVLWTAMITGYSHNNDRIRAICMWVRWASTWLHSSAGFEANVYVGSSLVDMYAKCGDLYNARRALESVEGNDVVSWNSMVVWCVRQGLEEEALLLFKKMHAKDMDIDDFTYPSVLNSCASMKVMESTKSVHCLIVKTGYEAYNLVSNALVDVDVVSWTSLVTGYAYNGSYEEALKLFCQLRSAGVGPDQIVIASVLSACAELTVLEFGQQVHTNFVKFGFGSTLSVVNSLVTMYAKCGCIKDAKKVFNLMKIRDVITWITLIIGYAKNGRSGKMNEAKELHNLMSVEPDSTVWKALLSACRVHKDIELAERAATALFELEPQNALPYVLLSNIYSAAGGWIWDQETLPSMGAWQGKELGLAYHCEKLVVAFGLLFVPQGAPIRIFKNLRVCGDCHAAMKFISRVFHQHIILRDSNCFHHFREGTCSCGDYW